MNENKTFLHTDRIYNTTIRMAIPILIFHKFLFSFLSVYVNIYNIYLLVVIYTVVIYKSWLAIFKSLG